MKRRKWVRKTHMIYLLTVMFIILFYISYKIKSKNKKICHIINIFLVTLVIEVYVFNCNSFRMAFKKYTATVFDKNSMIIKDMKYNENNDTFEITGQEPSIEILNINNEIATIKTDIDIEGVDELQYQIYYNDITNKEYRNLPEKYITPNFERSKYTACFLSGESSSIYIKLKCESEGQIKINNVSINEKIPFNFSIARVLFISLTCILIYNLITNEIFKIPFSEDNKKQRTWIDIIIIVFLIILFSISITSELKDGFYKDYTDSLLKGKLTLDAEPSEELISLENPYDVTQRRFVSHLWDAALYNNSYYVYYGILPQLILFIPVRVLLGFYLPIFAGVLIFSIFVIYNLKEIMCLLYKRWFNQVSFAYLLLSIIGVLSGSLIFWINRRPQVYELVLCAGIAFSTAGISWMLQAIEDEKKIEYRKLCLSAICLALAVACRPNHLLISLLFIPVIIKVLKINWKEKNKVIKTIAIIAIPYLIVGTLLMIYNYVRFDNPFEFGTSYQLTVNDMRNVKNRLATLPVGVFTQLFKLPVTTNSYPFYSHQHSTIPFFGYYYVESFVCGLFVLNPVNFVLIFLIGLKKKIKEKEAYKYICYMVGIAFFICFANIFLAGTLQRYSMDYAWILNIASYLTIFIIASNIKSIEIKNYILKIIIAITMFMFFINLFVGGIISESFVLKKTHPKLYYSVMYDICFWE